jgi:4-methylaminobutanoate oxidase (formaldehyde-forming)
MGPKAAAILARLSPEMATATALRNGHSLMIDLGLARVRAVKVSYIGGAGYELYVPSELMVTVYEALFDAGRDLGLIDAGYYTLDALRIEAGRRAFAAELGPDETPFEAGLGFAVKLDKAVDFIGRAALRTHLQRGMHKRLAMFSVDLPQAFAWGGEVIRRNGVAVGEVSSAGYSRLAGRSIVMGYVRSTEPLAETSLAQGAYHLDLAGELVEMTYLSKPVFQGR